MKLTIVFVAMKLALKTVTVEHWLNCTSAYKNIWSKGKTPAEKDMELVRILPVYASIHNRLAN